MALNYAVTPYAEALKQLRDKILINSDRWSDVSDDEADAFFFAAGAKGEILLEIYQAVEQARVEGWGFDQFRSVFDGIATRWTDMRGDKDWRARLIFQTNLRFDYGLGRMQYQTDPEVVKLIPYLEFVHSDNASPRPEHLALDGKVFEATKIPLPVPNGFGCGCWYRSRRTLNGDLVSQIQRGDLITATLPNGRQIAARVQAAPGWDYSVGGDRAARRQDIFDEKAKNWPQWVTSQVQKSL